MKHSTLLFTLLCLLWLALGATLLVPQSANVSGVPHPQAKFNDMHHGGDGSARHDALIYFAWIFTALSLIFFAALLSFGVRRDGRHPWKLHLTIGVVLELIVFSAMFVSYQQFLDEVASGSAISFLGPFPTPTTLMIVGVWVIPFYFVILYGVLFSRSVWTAEDAEKFQQLLNQSEIRNPKSETNSNT